MRALIGEALSDHFGLSELRLQPPEPDADPWFDQNETVASSIVDLTTRRVLDRPRQPMRKRVRAAALESTSSSTSPAARIPLRSAPSISA